MTGLDLGPLPGVDRYRAPTGAATHLMQGGARSAWTELTSFSDIAF